MRLVSVLCGMTCAGLIFGGLSLSQSAGVQESAAEIFEARQIALPIEMPPPPPPSTPTEVEVAPLASPIQLEIAASASPVHIEVPAVPLFEVDHAPPAARPEIAARFDLAKSAVRPVVDMGDMDSRRVFERGQVDQPPMVLQRSPPRISYNKAYNIDPPRRTVMLLVVNTDGSVGEVRVLQSAKNAEFDKIMMDAIRGWKFSPAIRKGRKVRCWVQQAIAVSLTAGSRFEAN